MNKILLLLLISLLTASQSTAQRLEIERIITGDYPVISAEFRGYDADSNEVRDYNISDIQVIDGGIERDVKSVICGDLAGRGSIILTLDRTTSMNEPVDQNVPDSPIRKNIEKYFAAEFINQLSPKSEIAITSFSNGSVNGSRLEHDYSSDKESLIDSISKLAYVGMTNFNAAFFGTPNGKKPGAFDVAEWAKFSPIIVFITDGEHNPNVGVFKVGDVISEAQKLGAKIYVITIAVAASDDLVSIADATGGAVYSVIDSNSVDFIVDSLIQNLDKIIVPCRVEWEAKCDGGDVEISSSKFGGISDTASYAIEDSIKPKIEIDNLRFYFINSMAGTHSNIVKICAKNRDVNINGYSFDAQKITVTNYSGRTPPFVLQQDECFTLGVEYESVDDASISQLEFDTDACGENNIEFISGQITSRDFDFGYVKTKTQDTLSIDSCLCNKTPVDVKIIGSIISGESVDEYDLVTSIFGEILSPGECKGLAVEFRPQIENERTSVLSIGFDIGINVKINLTGFAADSLTSVENPLDLINSFSIYPNPASDYITIHFAGNSDLPDREIQVVNSLGVEVNRIQIPAGVAEQRIDLNMLPKGVYYLKYVDVKALKVKKFVLN